MSLRLSRLTSTALLVGSCAFAQGEDDPFPRPIPASEDVINVNVTEFATLPESDGQPARMMLLIDEPGTRRLFVNDMRGPLYSVSYDGKTVTPYLDINAQKWGVRVQATGNERGFQSFAFHPQFAEQGAPGYGRFYTYTDTANMMPAPDFTPDGGNDTHDTVLLEWRAKDATASTYDGGPPRELFRMRQPFANHNAGHLAFNPTAKRGSPEFGLLYVGVADGGSGGDPLGHSQNLASIFGKLLRIDPLGTNSANGRYGIPADNPFLGDNNPRTLGEIYAYGVRNPQRFAWDVRTARLFLADIGQGIVEELSIVTRGANLGWNDWEGSYRFVSRTAVGLSNPRGDPKVTFPVVEYGQRDPLFQNSSAITGVVIYRGTGIPQLANLVLFGDNPSGEVLYINADKLPAGGQDAIRRVLFVRNGSPRTLLQLIDETLSARGESGASRADLRFGTGPNHQVFLLNKRDGVIRLLVP